MKQPYEVIEAPWNGWVELTHSRVGVLIRIGNRGVGHDEPSSYQSATLSFAAAAELRDHLSEIIPTDVEPTQTRQYEPRPCEVCGELVESERERFAWSGRRRRAGTFRYRDNWYGHIRCRPEWVPRAW